MISFLSFGDELQKIASTGLEKDAANKLQKMLRAGRVSFDDMRRVMRGGDHRSKQGVLSAAADDLKVVEEQARKQRLLNRVPGKQPGPMTSPELTDAKSRLKKLMAEPQSPAAKVEHAAKMQEIADSSTRQVGMLHRIKAKRLEREGFDRGAASRLAGDDMYPYYDKHLLPDAERSRRKALLIQKREEALKNAAPLPQPQSKNSALPKTKQKTPQPETPVQSQPVRSAAPEPKQAPTPAPTPRVGHISETAAKPTGGGNPLSAKRLALGTGAVLGIPAAGYAAYRHAKNKRTEGDLS